MSRRSSRKSNINKNMEMANIQTSINKEISKEKNKTISSRIPNFLFTLVLYGSILYYLYNLEDADCNCIRDWRHNFIKAMCLVIIFLTFISLFEFNISYKFLLLIIIIYLVLLIITIYAFFTYIGDLNDTQCACAVKKQPNLNSIMNFMRWLYVIIVGLLLVLIVILGFLGYSFLKSIF